MKAMLLVAVLLAGCQSVTVANEGRTTVTATGARISLTQGDRLLTGILVALVVADGLEYYVRGDDGTLTRLERVPQFDPSRRVNATDCTQPVDAERGNLLCR
jgi:hypothetical protein